VISSFKFKWPSISYISTPIIPPAPSFPFFFSFCLLHLSSPSLFLSSALSLSYLQYAQLSFNFFCSFFFFLLLFFSHSPFPSPLLYLHAQLPLLLFSSFFFSFSSLSLSYLHAQLAPSSFIHFLFFLLLHFSPSDPLSSLRSVRPAPSFFFFLFFLFSSLSLSYLHAQLPLLFFFLLLSLPSPPSDLHAQLPLFLFFSSFFWLVWFDFVRLIFLLVGLVCWGIFLGSDGCAAGDGESEKRREAGRCWVCCSRSKRRKNVKKKEK
jgi:hypothetical protein